MASGAPPAPGADQPQGSSIGFIGAAVAVTTWGTASVIAKWISMGALAIVTYRFAIYTLLVGGVRAVRGQGLSMAAFRRSWVGGVFLAADVALFFTAVKLTTVVNATIIGALQPILLTAYGVRFLGERVARRDLVLAGAALAGVVMIVLGGSDSGEASLLGDLAAVGALVCWSIYFVIAKKVNAEISPADFTISAAIITAVINAPLAVFFGQSLAWPSLENLLWLIGLALGAGILGHNLMNWSIVRIPLWLSATFTLLVPVVSSIIAWILLDEALTSPQIIGMTITVIALGILVWLQQSQPAAESIPAKAARGTTA